MSTLYEYGRVCSPGFLQNSATVTAMVAAVESQFPTYNGHVIAGDMVLFEFTAPLNADDAAALMQLVSTLDTYVYPVDIPMKRLGGLVYADTEVGQVAYIGTQSGEIHISKETQGHFTSLGAAIAAHPGQNVVFTIHPGVYSENNPIPFNSGCVLRSAGNAENTIIIAQNANANILNIQYKCSIDNVTVRGATGACGIYMDGSGSGGQGRYAAVTQCFIQNCNVAARSDGKNIHLYGGVADTLYMREVVVSTVVPTLMGFSIVNGGTIISAGLTTFGLPPIGGAPAAPIQYAYHCTGLASKIAASVTNGYYCAVGLYLDNDAQSELTLLTLKYNGVGIVIGPNGTGLTRLSVNSLEIANSVQADIVNYAPAALIEIHSGVFDDTKLKNIGGARINAKYGTNKNGKSRQRMLGIINVGTPSDPGKMFIGEGSADVFSFTVLKNSSLEAGTWTNVSALAEENTPGTLFDLVGKEVDSCVYMGRDDVSVGVKMDITVPCATGAVTWEYWNGTAWTEFDVMTTNSDAPYWQYMDPLRVVAQHHVRFGLKTNDAFAVKTLNGVAKKWVRMRVVAELDVVPRSEYVTGHVNCVKFGSDGACEYFGMSRPVKKLPIGDVQSAGNVGDQILYADAVLNAKRTRLLAGGGAFMSMQTVLPTNADVSFPMKVVIQVVGSPSAGDPVTADVTLTLSVRAVASGDAVYTSTQSTSDHQTYTITRAVTSNIANEFVFVVSIKTVNVNPANGQISTLWMQIERTADAYAPDVTIMSMFGLYVSASDGAHLLAY
jgi:hypothetical protein